MNFFSGVELYEAYGSTEAGVVTVLKPEDQMRKLGSIGFESLGTDFVKILDEKGKEVGVGEVGELYSRGPVLFEGYYKLPEKTESSFRGEWFSAGDMAIKDEDGFYQIVDRKDNMIITGGEHVYPSEVEETIGSRVLEPAEYLVGDSDPREAVAPGDTFNAVILIETPAPDATGFKLNVCYRMAGGQLRCAIEDFR